MKENLSEVTKFTSISQIFKCPDLTWEQKIEIPFPRKTAFEGLNLKQIAKKAPDYILYLDNKNQEKIKKHLEKHSDVKLSELSKITPYPDITKILTPDEYKEALVAKYEYHVKQAEYYYDLYKEL